LRTKVSLAFLFIRKEDKVCKPGIFLFFKQHK